MAAAARTLIAAPTLLAAASGGGPGGTGGEQRLAAVRRAAASAASGSATCDLPRVDARGLDWEEFNKRSLRGRMGVVLTGLFSRRDLARWSRRKVLKSHGNETFYADDTRGRYSFPRLTDYVEGQGARQMIFVSDSLLGMFGKAYGFAVKPPGRAALLRDFAERPILSVGVEGSAVPRHGSHRETWHAHLQGTKAWWVGPEGSAAWLGWEDPCGHLDVAAGAPGAAPAPDGVRFCVLRAGEVLYLGEGADHASCSLEPFSLGVGAQGHTESWPDLLRAANRGDLAAARQATAQAGAGGLRRALRQATEGYAHTPLHRAALHGHADVAEHLLGAGAEPDAPDAEGLAPIFLAAFSGHLPATETLAARGLGAAARDPKGAGPLQWAATQGHEALVARLVEGLGADARGRDSLGGGGASAAATMGHVGVMAYLQRQGGDLEEQDRDGMRPLHWAATHGHRGAAEWLLRQRADPLALARHGSLSAAGAASAAGHADVASLLRAAADGAPHELASADGAPRAARSRQRARRRRRRQLGGGKREL